MIEILLEMKEVVNVKFVVEVEFLEIKGKLSELMV